MNYIAINMVKSTVYFVWVAPFHKFRLLALVGHTHEICQGAMLHPFDHGNGLSGGESGGAPFLRGEFIFVRFCDHTCWSCKVRDSSTEQGEGRVEILSWSDTRGEWGMQWRRIHGCPGMTKKG